MQVHIIRVLREESDRSSRQNSTTKNYFCKDMNALHPGHWEPNTDIYESEEEVIVRVDLAGVAKEDLSVKVKDSKLQISGIRHGYKAESKVHYHQIELHCGEFCKTLPLPDSIAHNEISASFQNGILHIAISKIDQSIEIPISINSNLNSEG
jgi:HSP20 family protein